jgi:hypothetical protein
VAKLIAREETTLAAANRRTDIGSLALAYFAAGRDDDARRTAERLIADAPRERMPFVHWTAVDIAVLVHGGLGDTERAFELLSELQSGPQGHCGPFLRQLMLYASIRKHPDFEALAQASDWPTAR